MKTSRSTPRFASAPTVISVEAATYDAYPTYSGGMVRSTLAAPQPTPAQLAVLAASVRGGRNG